MSKKSLKKQDKTSKDEDSEGEDEEDLHAAIREMFRTSDIDVRPSTSSRYSELLNVSPSQDNLEKRSTQEEKPKNLTEQGSQTDGSSLKKPKTSKPENKKLESEDSWAAIFIKRFSWTKTPKTEAVPPEGNQTQPATNVSLRKGTENRSNFSKGQTQGAKSSTETSNESLLRTDYYHLSLGKSEERKSLKNRLNDVGSGEESSEFLEKLRKIEEASKPKTWKKPQPIVIKPNTNSPNTKRNKDAVEAKPQKDADEKHRYINILKVPFQRDLNYAAENEPNDQTTVNQQPKEKDTQPESPETIPEESSGFLTENPAEKREEKPAGNAEKVNSDNADSQRTFTITGHSHITAKWGKHCHFREKDTGVDKKARRILIIACILCSTFMIIEIVGGIVSNSLAIATDAAHLLTDLASFLISLFALYLAGRPSSERLNFGWYRAEVIGAMISVFFIWVITGILVYLAIVRWVNQDFELDAKIMLITSALAILFNLIMGCQLHQGHSHFPLEKLKRSKQGSKNVLGSQINHMMVGTSVSTQFRVKSETNINVRAAMIHVVGDLLQSIGVFVAALIIFFKPEWAFMDSVCTFLFSILVLVVTFKILKDVLMVLMEATPDYMDYEEVKQTFLSIPGVEHVHNLRIWALSINKVALSAHLAISKDADPQLILEEATNLIHKRFRFFETTIQIEEYSPDMEDCEQCLSPVDKNDKQKTLDVEKGEGGAERQKLEKTKQENG